MFTDSADKFMQNMLQDMGTIYGNFYLVAILTIFLGIATYTDIKSLKIPNKLNLAFGIIAIAIMPIMDYSTFEIISRITGSIVGFFALLIPAMIKMHQMGGDIKAMTVIGLFIGVFNIPIFLALACITAVAYIFIRFKQGKLVGNVPFAPFFLVSHSILFIISLFVI